MYHNPVEVVKTNDWLGVCNNFIEELGIRKPLLITSNGNMKRLNLVSFFDSKYIFHNVKPDPTFESCNNLISFVKMSKFDGVIAIGGGSVMDTAKVAMAFMGTGIDKLSKLLEFSEHYKKILPSIFLPTTHGTGSEVTMWGTIWNMNEKKKYSISHPNLYPDIAILDGNLTLTLPLSVAITTVLDALSHSFEAIWNKNANNKSSDLAIDAICRIIKNVVYLKENPLDLKIRNNLLEASNLAGLAFSNTKTAAAHSISYPLTIHYNIPHGIASSMPLIPLLLINKDSIANDLSNILSNLKCNYIDELIEIIRDIPRDIIKFRLRDWGVKKKELPNLVRLSFTKGRMDNNIVELTNNNVKNILFEIY